MTIGQIRYNQHTNDLYWGSSSATTVGAWGLYAANMPETLLKIGQTIFGWEAFVGACCNNTEVISSSAHIAETFDLGSKAVCLAGALKSVTDVGNGTYNFSVALMDFLGGNNKALDKMDEVIYKIGKNLFEAGAKTGEFVQFLFKTGCVAVDSMILGTAVNSFKIGKDCCDIVDGTFKIRDIVNQHDIIVNALNNKDIEEGGHEHTIHLMKTHESWLATTKGVAALVLHVLSLIAITAGVVFVAPTLLAIGTVVLVTAVACSVLSSTREAMEYHHDHFEPLKAALQPADHNEPHNAVNGEEGVAD